MMQYGQKEIPKIPKLNPKGEPWKIVYPTTESITKFFNELREGWEKDIILIRQGTCVSDSIARSYVQKHPFKTVEEITKIIKSEHPRPNTV